MSLDTARLAAAFVQICEGVGCRGGQGNSQSLLDMGLELWDKSLELPPFALVPHPCLGANLSGRREKWLAPWQQRAAGSNITLGAVRDIPALGAVSNRLCISLDKVQFRLATGV